MGSGGEREPGRNRRGNRVSYLGDYAFDRWSFEVSCTVMGAGRSIHVLKMQKF